MARYEHDRRAMRRLFLGQEAYRAVSAKTRLGANILRTIAPRDTGYYTSRIGTSYGTTRVNRTRRVVGYVTNDAPYAAALEASMMRRNNPPRPMRKTLAILRALDPYETVKGR